MKEEKEGIQKKKTNREYIKETKNCGKIKFSIRLLCEL